jgi:hypothetical protein
MDLSGEFETMRVCFPKAAACSLVEPRFSVRTLIVAGATISSDACATFGKKGFACDPFAIARCEVPALAARDYLLHRVD